jgi:hypothetical protein
MHPRSRVDAALRLRRGGLSATEIARRLAIPRGTVTDWLAGRVPRSRRAESGCAECGGVPHAFGDLPGAYVYLLGAYLGDGSIATHPRAFKLRINLDAAYPGIIEETATAMRAVRPQNKVNQSLRSGDVEVYSYSKAWPCLFPQHGPGKKHLRQITLTGWQQRLVERWPQLLLRGLIHSDGCRFINTGRNWSHPSVFVFEPLFRHTRDVHGDLRPARHPLDAFWKHGVRLQEG